MPLVTCLRAGNHISCQKQCPIFNKSFNSICFLLLVLVTSFLGTDKGHLVRSTCTWALNQGTSSPPTLHTEQMELFMSPSVRIFPEFQIIVFAWLLFAIFKCSASFFQQG